jgi:exonuclease III
MNEILSFYALKKIKSGKKVNLNKWFKTESDKISSKMRRMKKWTRRTLQKQLSWFFVLTIKQIFLTLIHITKTVITINSNEKMISLTIYFMLLRQNVESNPGMNLKSMGKDTLNIITYNCNGLGDQKKLKRLLRKVEPTVEKGGIILLQETHIVDVTYLKLNWKYKVELSCFRTNSAGVIILYNNELELIDKFNDELGRQLILVLKNEDTNLIVTNVYFPNDHKQGLDFAEKIYIKILEFQNEYPDNITLIGGDFNTCMNPNDSLNRTGTLNEKLLADTISSNNKLAKLVDAYRVKHKEEGYTWKRGTCFSRLDYIFVSTSMTEKVNKADYDWSFKASDHAAVKIELKLPKTPD